MLLIQLPCVFVLLKHQGTAASDGMLEQGDHYFQYFLQDVAF
jgi:hypothetical protein